MILAMAMAAKLGHCEQAAPADPPEESRKLDRVRAEIERLEAVLEKTRKEEKGLLGELQRMDLDLALHRRQLSYLSTELARTRIEIREAGLSVEETRRLLDERRRAMARRIRSLYMAGPPSFEHVLLTASSPAEVVTAYRWATRSSLADRGRVEEYRSAEVAWNDALHNLEGKKAALTLLLSSERVRTRELETLRRERSQLLSGVQKEALTQQGTLTEMIETRDALERLVRALSEGKTVSPDMRVGFDKFRGLLPWPVPGKILVPFGAQKNARFETLVPHPGIDLAVTEGEPIRAVHDGVVAFSDWFKGFGNLLVVEHGGGFMSVYAHASERLVATGDKVTEGQVIARAGDTGSLDGAKLYFEIIKDGKAENPVSWLTRR
jgi:murein hydrolase activator